MPHEPLFFFSFPRIEATQHPFSSSSSSVANLDSPLATTIIFTLYSTHLQHLSSSSSSFCFHAFATIIAIERKPVNAKLLCFTISRRTHWIWEEEDEECVQFSSLSLSHILPCMIFNFDDSSYTLWYLINVMKQPHFDYKVGIIGPIILGLG